MTSILITGATGFVGRTLLIRAVESGRRVWAPVRDEEKLHRQVAREGLDARMVTALPAEPKHWPGDVIPDQAVLSAGVLFARNRQEYFETNVDWTLRVLSHLPADCKTVVLSSQSAGGPTPANLAKRTEATPDAPLTWYGESKLALERAVPHERNVTILRPPMILGARDTATLPLFKMARGLVRPKPGLRPKFFSYLGVDDVVGAIFAAMDVSERGPFYIAADEPVSDLELIAKAARVAGARGVSLRIPQVFVRLLSAVVDAVPAMREATPSLTRDRAREIWADRWVVDAAKFRNVSTWRPSVPLEKALADAFAHYRESGQL